MDILGAINAAIAWFVANWTAIQDLAQQLAKDLAALWVLGLALAKVLKPFFPVFGAKLEAKVFGILKTE